MSIKIYTDAAATQEVSPTEYFIGDGTTKIFTISKFTGSTVSAVYQETKDTYTASITAGVSSALAGTLTLNQYRGYAAYHQVGAGSGMVFRGYVLSNTAGTGTATITLSDSSYTAASDSLVLVNYTKLSAILDYSITGQSLTLNAVTAPAIGINIYAVGASPANLNFGDAVTAVGANFTRELKLYLKRDPLYAYSDIQISSDNLSQTTQTSVYTNATIAAGVVTLGGAETFEAVNSEVGKAVNRAGVFIGHIVSNTTTTATLNTLTLTNAVGANYTVYTVGELLVAPDSGGVAGTYAKVLQGGTGNIPATLDVDTVYPFWVKGVVPVPAVATNYSENIIKIAATEYLA